MPDDDIETTTIEDSATETGEAPFPEMPAMLRTLSEELERLIQARCEATAKALNKMLAARGLRGEIIINSDLHIDASWEQEQFDA